MPIMSMLLRLFVLAGAIGASSALSPQLSGEATTRRRLFQASAAVAAPLLLPTLAIAADDEVVLRGTVKATEGDLTSLRATGAAALYLTLKRGAAPQEILGLVKGTPNPPIGAVRIPLASITAFPYEFEIRQSSLFADAPALLAGFAVTVAARLDGDGVAATRGADDLVGSAYTTVGSPDALVLELKSRGTVSNFLKK
ncbi:hypothetical protein M885DRAFT_514307 [Pelagophyceae sp. CCMP2097]|nr:hypothetical protein M885DRAFT_514307 [Pelagophyceae sp. CCMP2097]|mmetsp:Transcript_16756/g.56620  ORF Transcript_16756/g.56620 Transcript_16756/m.56620 type:complete len:198 (+) Transcript_16756:21-614(+)